MAFYANPSTNFGWRLSDQFETSGTDTTQEVGFRSTENNAQRKDLWPTLLIDSDAPCGCDLPPCSISGTTNVCSGATNSYSGMTGTNLANLWTVSGGGTTFVGGGTTAEGSPVNVIAGSSGSYTLSLTVSNTTTGCATTCNTNVTVNALPDCSITGPGTV
jgi:hypothetical protein